MGVANEPADVWPPITRECKPWTRWWWLGSAVDDAGLEAELTVMAEAGFGGVEVAPIYGAKGAEDTSRSRWCRVCDESLSAT